MNDVEKPETFTVDVRVGEEGFLLVENEVRRQAPREEQRGQREGGDHGDPEGRIVAEKIGVQA